MRTVAFHNLGCKVNSYEIEVMQQNFQNNGYEIVPFDTKADIYVVNTCTVTNIADRKSRQILHRARKLNPDAIVVATGCYVQTSPDKAIADEAIDICIGNNRKSAIIEIVEEHIRKLDEQKRAGDCGSANTEIKTEDIIDIGSTDISVGYEDMVLTDTAERVRAYIKIQDGCNQFCSYCAIPLARGRVRSRKSESIIDEIKGLSEKGFKEFVLTGIHISSYGMDFIDKNSEDYLGNKDIRVLAMKKEYLLNLIKEVADIEGVKRIRLGSLEPRIITDRFASELADIDKICPHFHRAFIICQIIRQGLIITFFVICCPLILCKFHYFFVNIIDGILIESREIRPVCINNIFTPASQIRLSFIVKLCNVS